MKLRPLEGVAPGVFNNREQAEAALAELQEMGFSNDDFGVMVPDPARYRLIDDSVQEAWKGLLTGAVAGIPIGSLAGMGILALAVPGLGILGVGGALLVGSLGGALWGAYIGSQVGLAVEISHIEQIEHRYEIPLKPDEMLIVVIAGDKAESACEIMERHGARCMWQLGPTLRSAN